ncbi:MAG: hypothetical protein GTO18_14685 [Anaerolineales bacterium]|nr:hypothetical protein [Anaerolineales bacterium]
MAKIDLKKQEKQLYNPSKSDFEIVEVPPMNFLMVDGTGDPNTSQDFQDCVEALYSVSYTAKFMSKKDLDIDYVVMPLEGLWWVEDMATFSVENKEDWLWTLLIRQPDHLTEVMIQVAADQTRQKKNPVALSRVRFETYHEGKSAQIMHIGPFDEEGPTIARMHEYIQAHGLESSGKHHEIYLSDIRRTAPEKMRTVLRQPVRDARIE